MMASLNTDSSRITPGTIPNTLYVQFRLLHYLLPDKTLVKSFVPAAYNSPVSSVFGRHEASLDVQAQATCKDSYPLQAPPKTSFDVHQSKHPLPRTCLGWLHLCVQTHFSDTHGRGILQALIQESKTLVLHNTQSLLRAMLSQPHSKLLFNGMTLWLWSC